MAFQFPRELYPSALPSHEETNPGWDAFCGWGTYGGLNVSGVDSSSRPKIVAQQAHRSAVEGSRISVEGPSVPFCSPGACAWLSQWALREPLLPDVRAARRTAQRRYRIVREWIGKTRCSDSIRSDLQTYYNELCANATEPVRDGGSHAPVGAPVSPSVEQRLATVPGESGVRFHLSNLATGLEGLFGDVTIPKANYVVGSCIKCVRVQSRFLNGQRSTASAMLASVVDGSNHATIRFHSFDLGHGQGEYPYFGRVCCTALQMPTSIRQVDLCSYDDDPCLPLCALRLDDGSISVHDIRVATNEDPNAVKVADCSPGGSSCVALNPYWKGEWLTAANSGQIAIWSVQSGNCRCSDPVVCRGVQSKDSAGFAAGRKLQAHYGCHPRCVVVAEPMAVKMLDMRSATSAVELFSLPSGLLHRHEYLVRTVQLQGQPFYHCTLADHSLLLFDERFPGHCLLQCAIPCSSSATYLDMVDVSNCDNAGALIAVGCQESVEVYCYYISMSDPAPSLCMRPWRAGPLTEFMHLEATCPKPTEAAIVSHRIESAALMGLAVAASGSRSAEAADQRLVLFQLTSYGDVFVQTYLKQHSEGDEDAASEQPTQRACDVLPRSDETSHSTAVLSKATVEACRSWTDALLDQAEWVAAASRREATAGSYSGRHRLPGAEPASDNSISNADSHDLLAAITGTYGMKAHVACAVCSVPTTDAKSDGERCGHGDYASMVAADHMCYSCSMSATAASTLRTAVEDDAVLPADVDLENFMMSTAHFSVYSFTDPNSKLHMKLWHGDDIEESLIARDEEWRVYRESRQRTDSVFQPPDESPSSEEDSQDDAGSVSGSSCASSIRSASTHASRQRRVSISSSAGFIATPKKLFRHKESEGKMPQKKPEDELEAVPLSFLTMSTSTGSPRQLFRTPASQERPRKQKLVQGF